MNTEPGSDASSADISTPRKGWRTPATWLAGLILAAGLLWWFAWPLIRTLLDYRELNQATESTSPIGYVGVSLRRGYYDKPTDFFEKDSGKKRLWAAKGADGKPEFYDVSEADLEVGKLAGGFGRDSIPGIDYPIFEAPGAEHAARLPGTRPVHGVILKGGPRAYPDELLRKIEVVNDQGDDVPFAVVYDRQAEEARFYERRIDGRPATFGTTGYALGTSDDPKFGTPLLYDRKTRSLWLPRRDALVCVNGALKGKSIPLAPLKPQASTWSGWLADHPDSRLLVGSDRDGDRKPIPTE